MTRTTAGWAVPPAIVRARSRTAPLRTHPGSGWDANVWLLVLLVASFAVLLFGVLSEEPMPASAFFLPMVVGYLVLEQRRFSVLVLAVLACATTNVALSGSDRPRMTALVVMSIAGVLLVLSSHRSVLGARRGVGEEMLIDLRDRLMTQSELPKLPDQWYAQALLRSAGGDQFAGDFIVAATTGESQLEVVVVDVSGKGLAAGTRALQLSGAFGGLLGALPPHEFMTAANNYLLRQSWDEGFATAAHLTLDLRQGRFTLRTAGHPPGLQYHAGSGRWELLESGGPALGLLPDGEFLPASGVLRSGDSMLLYTDGLVETPDRDFRLGIDKLLGEAERLMSSGWDDSALRLLDRLESSHDDRAILLLHRR